MKTLRMVFKNVGGSNVTFSLRNPKEDITAAEVQGVMDTVISKNIFSSTGGDLTSKVRAEIVDTTETTLFEV
jgi:hypothetical protein